MKKLELFDDLKSKSPRFRMGMAYGRHLGREEFIQVLQGVYRTSIEKGIPLENLVKEWLDIESKILESALEVLNQRPMFADKEIMKDFEWYNELILSTDSKEERWPSG